jgi:hypothetical protein
MKLHRMALMMALVLFCTGVSFGQIEELSEAREKQSHEKSEGGGSKEVTFALHGYAQANFVAARNDIGVKGNKWINSRYEYPRAGATLQLELEGNAYDVAHFFSAIQLEYNAAGEKTNFEKYYWPNMFLPGLQYTVFNKNASFKKDEISKAPIVNVRETYVDLYSKHVTLRAGQQIISWGEIEGIETPSDIVIPWDYTTMSNYFEYSKLSVTAANLNFHFAKQQLQLIWMPIFQPAKLPLESLYNRGATTITRPAFEARNGEYAARLSGQIGNQFRYGLGFLYGFDDQPDSLVKLPVIIAPTTRLLAQITDLYYNRVMMPTLDLGIGIGEVLSWKLSANTTLTRDLISTKKSTKISALSDGTNTLLDVEMDVVKKSTVTYLTGPESSNMFGKFYVGLYLGQQWTLKYTKPDSLSLTKEAYKGYGQQYPYKWILTSNIQRNFLESDALEVQIRLALYTDPKLKKWDYVIYPYFMYKFTNGVSTALGFVFANRLGDSRTMVISETRYSF